MDFTSAEQLHRHYRGVKERIRSAGNLFSQFLEDDKIRREKEDRRLELEALERRFEEEARLEAQAAFWTKVSAPKVLPWREVVNHVSERYGFTVKELNSHERPKPLANARQESYWLTREITGKGYQEIGRMACRDHSTVMHGCEQFRKKLWAGEVTIAPEMALKVFGEC